MLSWACSTTPPSASAARPAWPPASASTPARAGSPSSRPGLIEDGLWDAPEDLSGNTRTLIKLFKDTKGWSYIKYSCMHCQKPSCVSVCPVSAMTKDPVTGIVDYSKDTCIGCRYCQVACPFNIPKFQWDRTVPQIVKCDLCRDTNLKDEGHPGVRRDLSRRGDPVRQAEGFAGRSAHPPHSSTRSDTCLTFTANTRWAAPTISTWPPCPLTGSGCPRCSPMPRPRSRSESSTPSTRASSRPIALYASLCCIAVRNLKKGEAQPAPASGAPKEGS